jgi:Cytochrome b5-like Heme/Steroid binding domain
MKTDPPPRLKEVAFFVRPWDDVSMFKELFAIVFSGVLALGSWVGISPRHEATTTPVVIQRPAPFPEDSPTDSPKTPRATESKPLRDFRSERVSGAEDGSEGSEGEGEDDEEDSRSTRLPQATPVQMPAQPSTNGTAVGASYSLAQVQTHKSSSDCWTTVNGSVYDVTSFIRQHPGGSSAIISLCGIDGSSAFDGQHGGQARPASELASFRIGSLSK